MPVIIGPDGESRDFAPLLCPDCDVYSAQLACPACGTGYCEDCAHEHACPPPAASAPLAPSTERMVSQFQESATIGSRGWHDARAGAVRMCQLAD